MLATPSDAPSHPADTVGLLPGGPVPGSRRAPLCAASGQGRPRGTGCWAPRRPLRNATGAECPAVSHPL